MDSKELVRLHLMDRAALDGNRGQGTRLVLEEINIHNLTFLRVKAHSSERGKARNIVYNKWEVARATSRNCLEDGSIIYILKSTRPVVASRLTKMVNNKGANFVPWGIPP